MNDDCGALSCEDRDGFESCTGDACATGDDCV